MNNLTSLVQKYPKNTSGLYPTSKHDSNHKKSVKKDRYTGKHTRVNNHQ